MGRMDSRTRAATAAAIVAALALPATAAAQRDRRLATHHRAGTDTPPSRSTATAKADTSTDLGLLVATGRDSSRRRSASPRPAAPGAAGHPHLGPRYAVTYAVPGPDDETPRARSSTRTRRAVPISFMQPGQRYLGTADTLAAGIADASELRELLVRAGLPKAAPPPAASPTEVSICTGDPPPLPPVSPDGRIRAHMGPDPLDLHHQGAERVIGVVPARHRGRPGALRLRPDERASRR